MTVFGKIKEHLVASRRRQHPKTTGGSESANGAGKHLGSAQVLVRKRTGLDAVDLGGGASTHGGTDSSHGSSQAVVDERRRRDANSVIDSSSGDGSNDRHRDHSLTTETVTGDRPPSRTDDLNGIAGEPSGSDRENGTNRESRDHPTVRAPVDASELGRRVDLAGDKDLGGGDSNPVSEQKPRGAKLQYGQDGQDSHKSSDQGSGEKMFRYMEVAGFGHKVPSKKDQEMILKEADRGDQLINEIVSGKSERTEESSYKHAENIRAISWSLYRKACMKNQGFIGGMVVLEDNGRLKNYLSQGQRKKTWFQPLSAVKRKMRGQNAVIYYDRASTHFQERRDVTHGIDFHGFFDANGKEERGLKLPAQKSQLHFGTLDGGKYTFIKFEYFGTETVKDGILHIKELAKKNISPEVGHREDVKPGVVQAIGQVLQRHGIPQNDRREFTNSRGKLFTVEKSGLAFARLVIEEHIKDPAKKNAALADIHEIPVRRRFRDKTFSDKIKETLRKFGRESALTQVSGVGQEGELAPEEWLETVLQILAVPQSPETGLAPTQIVELRSELQTVIDKYLPLVEHADLRQGDEVIFTKDELIVNEDKPASALSTTTPLEETSEQQDQHPAETLRIPGVG